MQGLSGSQFATFLIDDQFFGIDVLAVQEVLPRQEMTPVPLAPVAIRGLINLRGQIVTAIDLRVCLGLPARGAYAPDPMTIVIRTQDGVASLLVDAVGEVLELDRAALAPAPDNLSSPASRLIQGVFQLQDRLLVVLDTERTLEIKGDSR